MANLTIGCIFGGSGQPAIGAGFNGFKFKYICEPRDWFVPDTIKHNWGEEVKISRKLSSFRDIPVDLIVGSPPCSKYSLLNRTKTRLDLYSTKPETVEYTMFLREIKKRQPKAFILENLPRIRNFLFFPYNSEDCTLYVNFYDKEQDQMLSKVVISLPGYKVFQYIIDTIDVGLAQGRKRLFIVGIRDEYKWFYRVPNVSQPTWFNQATRDIPKNAPNQDKVFLQSEKDIKKWKTRPYGTKDEKKARKIAPKSTAPTIIGAGIQHYHYKEPRFLTVRECARVHGIPDDFEFKGSVRQQLNQIGRSIAPPIIESLSLQVKVAIESKEQTQNLDRIFGDIKI